MPAGGRVAFVVDFVGDGDVAKDVAVIIRVPIVEHDVDTLVEDLANVLNRAGLAAVVACRAESLTDRD